jgi:hypothetical protein
MRRCQRLPVMLRTPLMPSDSIASISRRVPVPAARTLRKSAENCAQRGSVSCGHCGVQMTASYASATLDRPSSAGPMMVANCAAMMRARAMTSA